MTKSYSIGKALLGGVVALFGLSLLLEAVFDVHIPFRFFAGMFFILFGITIIFKSLKSNKTAVSNRK